MGMYSKRGFQFSWFQEGHGPKILFLPGWAEVPLAWKESCESRLPNYEKIYLTLGGHYPAEFPKGKSHLSVEEFLLPHFEVIEQISEKQEMICIGHSTGALVLWHYYNQFPERVKKLILVGGFLEGPLSGFGKLIGWLKSAKLSFLVDMGIAFQQSSYHFFLESVFSVNPSDQEEFLARQDVQTILPRFYESYKRLSPTALRIVAEVLDESRIQDMDLIEGLNLHFIHGENDPVIPIAQVQKFCSNYPTANLYPFANCGHSPHWEKKEEFWNLVEKIIR